MPSSLRRLKVDRVRADAEDGDELQGRELAEDVARPPDGAAGVEQDRGALSPLDLPLDAARAIGVDGHVAVRLELGQARGALDLLGIVPVGTTIFTRSGTALTSGRSGRRGRL